MRSSMLSANLDDIIKELSTVLPEVDKNAMLDDPDVGDEIVESFRASLRVSADGWVDDERAAACVCRRTTLDMCACAEDEKAFSFCLSFLIRARILIEHFAKQNQIICDIRYRISKP